MIDLKEMRAAAEAAIKKYGGYPVTDPAFVIALLDRLEAAEKEIQLVRNAALEEASKTLEGYEFIQDGITYRETKHAGSWQVKSTLGLFVTANTKKIRSLKS